MQKGIEALKAGCDIVTDTQMARAGINKTVLESLGGAVHCFMSDADVAQEAKRRGVTRAFCLENLMQEGALLPALIIGVPVGFVNVVESKEQLIASSPAPFIVARGRKGGSNVAAAICNALLYQIRR